MDLALLALILALAFANGTNDVSNAIATLVGSGVTNYPTAIRWGTVWTIAGAGLSAFVATTMVKTFSTGLVQPDLLIPPALRWPCSAVPWHGSSWPHELDYPSRPLMR